jgi:cystathionine beta-synthase
MWNLQIPVLIISKRLATETPNSWYVNQYDNPSNAIAHYEQTGPEIWEQTEGKITIW